MAAASGSTSAGRAAERLGGGEREHRADALAAGEQRVAHRLLEPGGAGLRGEAKALEVVRRPGPGARPGRRRPPRVRSQEALLPLRLGGPAGARVDLGAEPRGQLRAALDEVGRLVARRWPPSGACRPPPRAPRRAPSRESGEFMRALHSPAGPRPRIPFTKPGASAEQSSLAASTASSIATSAGTSGRCSISCSATRRMLRSSGAMRSSVQPLAWRAIELVELVAVAASTPSTSSRVKALASRSSRSSAGRPVTSDW